MAARRNKKTTPEELQAREHVYLTVPCPKCGAALGVPCRTQNGTSHLRRVEAVTSPGGRSVRAIPTAVETSRRRH
jgi:hypothetical protein